MEKQMELLPKSNTDKLADYFSEHVYRYVNFTELANKLNMNILEVVQSWNELNRDHRILKINVGNRDYVIQTLHEELPKELNPACFNKSKYQIISHDTGMLFSDIQGHIASDYGLHEWDYNPSIYRKEV